MKFDVKNKNKYPIYFVAGCVISLIISLFVDPSERLTVLIALLTAIGGCTAFLYTNHSQEIELFRNLFREFNCRYDEINGKLHDIYNRPEGEPLNANDKEVLYDYFNLCAEEQMFAHAGYIDQSVWCAWKNGMRYFSQDPEICDLWQHELTQDSYYGFVIPK